MNFTSQPYDLTADEVAIGLLDRGLFADKLPPCFTTIGLFNGFMTHVERVYNQVNTDEKKLAKLLRDKSHDYIRYNSLRHTNIPRHMGIPHPESYAFQVFVIKLHWLAIQKHCQSPTTQVTRIYVRRCKDGDIFKMNYKGSDRWLIEESDLESISGKNFSVEADIASCYPSIYTHSIPWALNGKNVAKKNKSSLTDAGNLLDKVTQGLRDGQTNGLLIGPVSSSIISEIILTKVDAELCNKGFKNLRRHIDDYEYYATDGQDAQSFLHELGFQLREFELTINDKKTTISKIPMPSRDGWVRRIRRFRFPRKKSLSYSFIKPLLDLSLELSLKITKYSPIYYAMKQISNQTLNDRAKRMMVQHCMNLSLSIPYLVTVMDDLVFEKHAFDGMHKKIETYANRMLEIGIDKLYTDSIAYSIYFACRYNIKLDLLKDNKIKSLLKIDDCVSLVLLHEYAKLNNDQTLVGHIKTHADKLKSKERRDIDKYWLLVYQVFTEKELKAAKQEFLAELKSKNFQFVKFKPLLVPEANNSNELVEATDD